MHPCKHSPVEVMLKTNVLFISAQCRVVSHSPMCYCLPGFIGDPFNGCQVKPAPHEPKVEYLPVDPCNPSPCGSNGE